MKQTQLLALKNLNKLLIHTKKDYLKYLEKDFKFKPDNDDNNRRKIDNQNKKNSYNSVVKNKKGYIKLPDNFLYTKTNFFITVYKKPLSVQKRFFLNSKDETNVKILSKVNQDKILKVKLPKRIIEEWKQLAKEKGLSLTEYLAWQLSISRHQYSVISPRNPSNSYLNKVEHLYGFIRDSKYIFEPKEENKPFTFSINKTLIYPKLEKEAKRFFSSSKVKIPKKGKLKEQTEFLISIFICHLIETTYLQYLMFKKQNDCISSENLKKLLSDQK